MYEVMPKKYIREYPNPNKHLHGLKLPFRMLICAPSGSGKSNMVVNLLQMFCAGSGSFLDIHLFTRDKDESLYRWLESLSDRIIVKEGLSELPDLKKMDKDESHLIIFDDLVLLKDQSRITELFIRGRKLGCSMIYISQSYFAVPKIIRLNINYLAILRLSSIRDAKLILSELSIGLTQEQMMKLYEEATQEKLCPFVIHLDETDNTKKYRKGMIDCLTP